MGVRIVKMGAENLIKLPMDSPTDGWARIGLSGL